MHLLIIEDDIDLGLALQSALKSEGFTCLWVRKLCDAPPVVGEEIDCVLLDLSLPDGDGLSLLGTWRKQNNTTPVVIITARSAVEERLAGLDGGADDFIVKPFIMAELISRLWAVHRRSARQASEIWNIGDISIEPRSQ